MNWWHTVYVIDNKQQTPTQYLQDNYLTQTDKQIAKSLSKSTSKSVTKNAVEHRRRRLELHRDVQLQTNNTQSSFEIENNYAVAQAPVSSLDELIKQCNIDTNVWGVEKFKVWQGFAKVDGELTTVPLSSASFVRKEPLAVLPTIKVIKATTTYKKPKIEDRPQNVKTTLVFSDLHIGFKKDLQTAKLDPFHNRRAIDIVLKIADYLQPDRIDILGDLFDFSEWTDHFIKDPEFAHTTQATIVEAYYILENLRCICKNSQINLHNGNHEARIERAIKKYLPSAYGLRPATKLDYPSQLTVENLLDLKSLNINYITNYPNDWDTLGNSLELLHGEKALAEFRTVSDVAKNSTISKVFGHTHRLEMASHTHWNGHSNNTVEALSVGCLCRLDGIVPGYKKRQQWQGGFAVISCTNDYYNYNLIPIKDNSCIFDYYQFNGIDYTELLKDTYPDWNW